MAGPGDGNHPPYDQLQDSGSRLRPRLHGEQGREEEHQGTLETPPKHS